MRPVQQKHLGPLPPKFLIFDGRAFALDQRAFAALNGDYIDTAVTHTLGLDGPRIACCGHRQRSARLVSRPRARHDHSDALDAHISVEGLIRDMQRPTTFNRLVSTLWATKRPEERARGSADRRPKTVRRGDAPRGIDFYALHNQENATRCRGRIVELFQTSALLTRPFVHLAKCDLHSLAPRRLNRLYITFNFRYRRVSVRGTRDDPEYAGRVTRPRGS